MVMEIAAKKNNRNLAAKEEIRMHIMLINHYAGSNIHGMEFRPYYLAREWVKSGHEVTIITASYSHLRHKNKQIDVLEEEYVEGIRYLWLPTSAYQGNGIRRLKNMLQFVYQLYKNLSKLASLKPDAVIASSTYPLDSYPAYKLAKKQNPSLFLNYMIYGRFHQWN